MVSAFVERMTSRQGREGARPSGTRVLTAVLVAAISIALAALLAAGPAVGAKKGATSAKKSKPTAKRAAKSVKKSMWTHVDNNNETLFPVFNDLGVGLHSTVARWDQIAPTTRPANPTDPNDPAYQWSEYLDVVVKEGAQYGIQIQMMILGAPPWANNGQNWAGAPINPKDYGDFAAALAKRYPSVNLFMAWGEPNRAPNFQPFTPATRPTGKLNKAQQEAPRHYAEMVDEAYRGVTSVDSGNKIIAGNTYTSAGKDDINPYQWARYMVLPDGSRPRFDMWGHNPFGFDKPELTPLNGEPAPRGTVPFSDLRFLVRELDRNFKGRRLPLFLAEWGVPVGFKDKDLLYTLPPKEAKAWIRAGYKIAKSYKRIYTLGWIHPQDTDRSSQGLLNVGGQRKVTYSTFRAQ